MDTLSICETKVLFFQLASSDEAALKTLMIRCSPKLKRYICSLKLDTDTASDVLTEIWIKVWEQRSKLFRKRAPLVWIKKCVRNHALNMRTKINKNKTLPSLEYELYSTDCPERALYKRKLEQTIKEGVIALSPQRRKIYELVFTQRMKYKDAAVLMNLSVFTVRNQIVEIRLFLRNRLHDY